ncbi:MAG: WD40 domain-containing protein [Gemmataceae bacterium]|nr:WD40 domain-containing protein [Gemmataceae bacterium]MDW8263876.1 WD40 repeat domain-containing protein [Gemmataceae bacterium]
MPEEAASESVVQSRHTARVRGVAWSPDGQRVLTGLADGTTPMVG